MVGRETELAQLNGWFAKALNGERQLVFVTGEAGIGKTTLVDAFLQTLAPSPQHPTPSFWLGRGQCIEQYGAGEAYMPILEVLGRLCRESGGERLIALLNQHAPTWLVQMPTLLSPNELETLQRKVQGATQERMLREMAEAIDKLTAERPLVLWLEDLHWSDASTLELLALLARRREQARLLVIGTYRPVDVIVREHPLKAIKQELQLHGQCQELAVRLLSEEHIAVYLAAHVQVPSPARAGEGQGEGLSASALTGLAHAIHQRTEGNPLFMVNVVDELLMQGKVDNTAVEISTPVTIRHMIDRHLERLSAEEQRVLEVASVAGAEFSAAAVAVGAEVAVDEVEEHCAILARRGQFLRADGTAAWPDGTVATHYTFLHALYQEVTYERIPMGRRIHLHQRIGERLEAAYSKRASEIAGELAVHFEQGRYYRKAVQYLQHAGQNAVRRSAHREAITHLTKGLGLLQLLSDAPERAQQELHIHMSLGVPLIATKGMASPELERTFERARELCQQLGETSDLFGVLVGLWLFHITSGQSPLQTARELAEQLLHLAQDQNNSTRLQIAHVLMANTLFFMGELPATREHVEQGMALHDPATHVLIDQLGVDSGTAALSYDAFTLWLLGFPDQALKRSAEAVTWAQELAQPFNLAIWLQISALFHVLRGEEQVTRERAEAAMGLSAEFGFPDHLAWGPMHQGWALGKQGDYEGGIELLRKGLAGSQASGYVAWLPFYLGLLAELYGKIGRAEEGLLILAEAYEIRKKGDRWCEAELYRLKGELTLQAGQVLSKSKTSLRQVSDRSKARQDKPAVTNSQPFASNSQTEAEACFHKAIDIARQQQAKSWELRASTSLARLWQQQGKRKEAHNLLAEIYGWFTEGFGTKDLQEAKALLDALAR